MPGRSVPAKTVQPSARRAPAATAPSASSATTRDRIKAIASDIYVMRGYDGFNFGAIAEAVGTTRANIHHHFGGKHALVGELVGGFAQDAASRITRIWSGDGLGTALRLQLDDLRAFHRRYNPRPHDRNVWSPLARLRLDEPQLGPLARAALEGTDRLYDETLTRAVARAVAAGELRRDTPVDDVARILRAVILSCAPMTQDTGDFTGIEKLFAAMQRSLLAAWGGQPGGRRPA
jgi:AcrR family transcriptional regulator